MKKFKPNFYWYLRNHPVYIIGSIVVGSGIVAGLVNTKLILLAASCSFLFGAMIVAIISGYYTWKKGVLTQYDEEGNDITTKFKKK